MTDDPRRSVRSAIDGAGRAFQVIDGGRPPPGDAPTDDDACPVAALGHLDGTFYFLDVRGQKRSLTARALGSRHELVSLFLGDDAWLRRRFPKRVAQKEIVDGEQRDVERVVDFRINAASAWLQAQCADAGLFGTHVALRAPGVWSGPDGLPVVHLGDAVLASGVLHPAGYRLGGQIWAAAAPQPRPSTPCPAQVGRDLQEAIKALWNFRDPGSEIAVLGLLGTAYYGQAADWRPAGFLLGGVGSGKSSLHRVMRACCPMRHETNDTTKAGIEQAVDGRAMPIFIDEASDREDQRGARMLLDLVLTASGAEGTHGYRGGADGKVRKIELAGAVIMASVAPPVMQPQHQGRFTLIELQPPVEGEDYADEHKALAARMRALGPSLWGRALASFERYQAARRMFRIALGVRGCAPREMDQLGSLLAGWWMLTEEGVPDDRAAREGVSALDCFVRLRDDVREDDAPRRMMRYLLGSTVQIDRSTDREQVGQLIETVLRLDGRIEPESCRRVLAIYGIRVIRADEAPDRRGRPAPRAASGFGVWFSLGAPELGRLFAGSAFEGDRWKYEMRRLESARQAKSVRIGTIATVSIWVSAEELGFCVSEFGPDGGEPAG